MYLQEMSTICIKPLRIAFDHIGVRKPYETAIRMAHEVGLHELSNYMLYNFHDGPDDLFERMRLNVTLNEELGVRIWSFPMRFQPTDRPDRGHIGEKWTRFQLRSMQIILQATHGVVSGELAFFKRAFGDTFADYERILAMPHDIIFNRDYYENGPGRAEFDDYQRAYNRLTEIDRAELLGLLSSRDPRYFHTLRDDADSDALRAILPFYVPRPKEEWLAVWQSKRTAAAEEVNHGLAEDERVEDAGLDYEDTSETPDAVMPPIAA